MARTTRTSPTVEVTARGERIDAEEARAVLEGVVQHVAERVMHFAGCAQDAGVETVGEHTAKARPQAVQAARDSHAEAAHAAS